MHFKVLGRRMTKKDRITEQAITTCSPEIKRINDSVLNGFHVRLGVPRIDGARLASYYFFYRVGGRNGRQVNYFIGNSETMDAGLARRIALQIELHVKAGKDIEEMKFSAEKEQAKVKDFWRFLGREFIAEKYKNGQEICRLFEQHILPQIGSIQLAKINQRIVELRIINPLLKVKKFSTARSVIVYLKQLLKYAVKMNYLDSQPIDNLSINREVSSNDDKHREHELSLTGAQLKGIYYRASKVTGSNTYLFTLRLQILSGQSLATICRAFRQDIKGNKWLLRDRNGKLSGKVIPCDGPLKTLLKHGVKQFTNAQSLYLLPGKGARKKDDRAMDAKSLAKLQQQFIFDVHGSKRSMGNMLKDIEKAMIDVGVSPLVVAYLFHRKVDSYLVLANDDPAIAEGLNQWYRG